MGSTRGLVRKNALHGAGEIKVTVVDIFSVKKYIFITGQKKPAGHKKKKKR
jgi:hypothetical protein